MDEQAVKIGAIIFLVGLPFLVFFQWKLGLTARIIRHQRRKLYELVVGLFFAVCFGLMVRPDALDVARSLLFALALSLPAAWWIRRYYDRKIDNQVLVTRRLAPVRRIIIIAIVIFGGSAFVDTPIGNSILEARWPFLGLILAWPIFTIYAYLHVSRLERDNGHPLQEVTNR